LFPVEQVFKEWCFSTLRSIAHHKDFLPQNFVTFQAQGIQSLLIEYKDQAKVIFQVKHEYLVICVVKIF